jgi:hypothetical protein
VELKLKALNDKSNVIGLQEKCHEKDAKSDSSSIQSPKISAKYNKYESRSPFSRDHWSIVLYLIPLTLWTPVESSYISA